MQRPAAGKLYLIPTPLGEHALETIPAQVTKILQDLDYFIAERSKTARHFIKDALPDKSLASLHFFELNKHTAPEDIPKFLQPITEGQSIGLLSEAGCPGVADPGAVVVNLAHQQDIEVVPLVGPSSILLALMASGLNGQQFTFNGYLPIKTPELRRKLKQLLQQAEKHGQTQIFIETPYRNDRLLEELFRTLNPSIQLCIAADLTLPTAYIRTKTIARWRVEKRPDLKKRPAVFLIGP